MLEKEYQYYNTHEDGLLKQYAGKFIAIVGVEVVGVFDTELAAFKDMKEKYPPGYYLLRHVLPK